MSHVKFQTSNVKCQMSSAKCQMTNVKWQMTNVKWRMWNVECPRRMTKNAAPLIIERRAEQVVEKVKSPPEKIKSFQWSNIYDHGDWGGQQFIFMTKSRIGNINIFIFITLKQPVSSFLPGQLGCFRLVKWETGRGLEHLQVRWMNIHYLWEVLNKLASLEATLVRNSADWLTDWLTDRGKV